MDRISDELMNLVLFNNTRQQISTAPPDVSNGKRLFLPSVRGLAFFGEPNALQATRLPLQKKCYRFSQAATTICASLLPPRMLSGLTAASL
jgi:hypothetical protein